MFKKTIALLSARSRSNKTWDFQGNTTVEVEAGSTNINSDQGLAGNVPVAIRSDLWKIQLSLPISPSVLGPSTLVVDTYLSRKNISSSFRRDILQGRTAIDFDARRVFLTNVCLLDITDEKDPTGIKGGRN